MIIVIKVAGQDRAAQFSADFHQRLRDMVATGRFLQRPQDVSALQLRAAQGEGDYTHRLIALLHHRNHVDLTLYDIPTRPGLKGALFRRVKTVLWKLLRYQHDRVCFRQNLINSHLSAAIEFEHQVMADEISRLQARVSELESSRPVDRSGHTRSA